MDFIVSINDFVNGIVWGVPLLMLILLTGVYYTIRLGAVQFAHPKYLFRKTIKKAFAKKDDDYDKIEGDLTSFQAAMVSVAAIVGSGNIAGVATAIVVGGPGALVWVIVAALFGMASKFAEIALGIKYRETDKDGALTGGAMYYIEKGLHARWLGIIFSILVIPFAFVISGIVDTNTIALTLYDRFGTPTIVTGAILAILVAVIVFGGVKRIGQACAIVSPFMGIAYIVAGLLIIILNIKLLPGAIATIFKAAFNPSAYLGGVAGSFFICMKSGVARGLYSNEAGLGTAAMIHSSAKVKHPIEQAVWGPVEVFLDTILVCTISALAIVMSGLWTSGLDGATLTVAAFEKMLPGSIGAYICIASVVLFGFSCLISYYNYAERAVEYIFGASSKIVVKVLWVIAVFVGSQTTLGFAWDLADTCNGLMIIPNLIAILILSKEVIALKNEYFNDPTVGLKGTKL